MASSDCMVKLGDKNSLECMQLRLDDYIGFVTFVLVNSVYIYSMSGRSQNRGLIFHSTDRTSEVNNRFIIWLN